VFHSNIGDHYAANDPVRHGNVAGYCAVGVFRRISDRRRSDHHLIERALHRMFVHFVQHLSQSGVFQKDNGVIEHSIADNEYLFFVVVFIIVSIHSLSSVQFK